MLHEHDLHNQRRNLLLISFAVLITNLAGINSLSVFGTSISTSNPELIPVFLLIILLYLLIRYLLMYLEKRPETGIFELLNTKRDRYSGQYLLKKILKKGDEDVHKFYEQYPRVIGHFNPEKNAKDDPVKGTLLILENIVFEKNNPLSSKQSSISARRYKYFYALSILYMTFRTPKFLEYFFPPIFSLFALATFNDTINCWVVSLLRVMSKII